MERLPFVLRFGQENAPKALSDAQREALTQTLCAAGADNFSIWQIEDFWFCYGEYTAQTGAQAAAQTLCAEKAVPQISAVSSGSTVCRIPSFIGFSSRFLRRTRRPASGFSGLS